MAVTWKKLAFDAEVVKHSLATAANDFLVASGSGVFVKNTLVEIQTLLGLDDSWIFRDEFITAKANGAINGSACDPGPGTRALTDSTGLTVISGGKLVMPGDGANDVNFMLSSIARVPNRTLFTKINISNTGCFSGPYWWDGGDNFQGLLFIDGVIYMSDIEVGTFAYNTDYYVTISLQADGAKAYIKGGTYIDWTFLKSVSGAYTPMYPGLYSQSDEGVQVTYEFLRVADIPFFETLGLVAPDFLINQVFN